MREARLQEIEAHAACALAGGDCREDTVAIWLEYGRFGPNEALELLSQVRLLRAALRRYGRHEAGPDGCRFDPCTCGLALLQEGTEGQ